MFKPQVLTLILTCVFGLLVRAATNTLGSDFIRFGERINQSGNLSENQIAKLNSILREAQDVFNGAPINTGYICLQGTLYGPNGLQKWTGDSDACSNAKKVKIGHNYACAMGTVYGPNNGPNKFEKWSGDSLGCGDINKINIGYNYVCITGTIYGPNGFEKWTGDSSYCGKVTLD